MTKAQAIAMNKRFMAMDSTIKNSKLVKKTLSESVAKKDSAIHEINVELMKKPQFLPVSKTDVTMSAFFVSYSLILLLLVL